MINEKAVWPGWETVRPIGQGSFGAVYEIRREVLGDVEKAALKVITIPQNDSEIEELVNDGYDSESITTTFQAHLKNIVAEYSIMRKMNGSSNIVNCDDVRYVQHDDGIGWDIYIKMELLTPLNKALPVRVDENTVIKVGKDLCNALELCRKHDIVHRDIKPQNIFVSENGDYKLGDFGIARTMEKTMGGTRIGTVKFMAPEVFNNQPYGSASDIYAVGLVLYWLLNERRMPFLSPAQPTAGMDEEAGLRRLRGDVLPAPANGSAELHRIVLKACAFYPHQRYATAAEMLNDLENLSRGIAPIIPAGSEPTVLLSQEQTTLLTQNAPYYVPQPAAPVAAYGYPAAPAPATIQPEQPKKKKRLLPIILILLILLLLLGAVLLFGGLGDKPENPGGTENPGASTAAPESTGSTENTGSTESTEATGSTESTESTQASEPAQKVVASVEISSQPAKKQYTAGETLDTAGLGLKVTYEDGSSETISEGFVCNVTTLNAVGTQTVTVTYGGKIIEFTVEVAEADVILQALEITKAPEKEDYIVGETVDLSGIQIKATYSDGHSTVLGAGAGLSCSPDTLNTAGKQTVTVTYQGKTVSFDVTVKEAAVLQSISVAANPQKTSYFVGDFLDTAGLELKLTYSDGSAETISSGFTCSPTTLSTAGTQKITVTCQGKTVTFDVTVKVSSINGISILSAPDRSEYFVGDLLDTAGMTLEVSYDDGKKETVTSGFTCNISVFDSAGLQTVQVSYGGQRATFAVNVQEVELIDLSIKTMPNRAEYFVGDMFDTTGLSLTAQYNNGTSKTITTGFACSAGTFANTGYQTVTVTYFGCTATFEVLVNSVDVVGISIKTKPTKVNYFVGETLKTSGLSLTVNYNNGSSKSISSGFSCDPTVLYNEGVQTVYVYYEDCQAEFTVEVTSVELTGITIKTKPFKTDYFVGDTLDTYGLSLQLTYNDGSTHTVDNGYDCDVIYLREAGTETVTVTYEGKKATFTVTVQAVAVSKITVSGMPYQTEYRMGDTLNTEGLMLSVTYTNGDEDPWVSSGFTCSPVTLNTAGTQTITVTYAGKSTTFTVTVLTTVVAEISVSSNPHYLEYNIGDKLNLDGLSLEAKFADNRTEEITEGFTCSPTKLDKPGNQTITVSYGGKTTTFTVMVRSDEVASISISSKPQQTNYFVGDTLNDYGLAVNITYVDGRTDWTEYNITCSPTVLNSAGTQTITVTYQGKTTTFKVTVTTPQVTLSSYSGTSTFDATTYGVFTTNNKPSWDASLPTATSNTGSSISWEVVSGDAFIANRGGVKKLFVTNPAEKVVARAYFYYNGVKYYADYTNTLVLKKTTSAPNNLRKGPGTSYGKYTSVPTGVTLTVTEVRYDYSTRNSDGVYWAWGKVSYGGYTGWVVIY